MTDFYIGFPQIPFLATTTTASDTLASGCSVYNLATGDRGNLTRLASAKSGNTQVAWTYTSTTDYLYIARADLLAAKSVNSIAIDSSSDGSSWTNRYTNSSFSAANLTGVSGEDYIATWSTTGSYAYWRSNMGNSATSDYPCSKIYLGNLFNLGRNPIYSSGLSRIRKGLSIRRAPYFITLNWRGITDAIRKTFTDNIGRYAEINPVVLYDKNATLIPFYVLHSWLKSFEFTPIANNTNDLVCTFEECI